VALQRVALPHLPVHSAVRPLLMVVASLPTQPPVLLLAAPVKVRPEPVTMGHSQAPTPTPVVRSNLRQ